MNAIELLEQDHKKVKAMLAQLSETTDRAKKTRQELLNKISEELHIHTQIEEQIFYPAFRAAGKKDERNLYEEAVEEHRAVEGQVMPDLEAVEPDSEAFAGRAKVLKELIEHHVEEEESEMFVRARKLFSEEELNHLGNQMLELKEQLTKH